MLTVVLPAPSKWLTSRSRARSVLLHHGETLIDEYTEGMLLDQASAAVVSYCRRPFALEFVRETFRSGGGPMEGVMLTRHPATSPLLRLDGVIVSPLRYYLDERDGQLYSVDTDGWHAGWWNGSILTVEYYGGYNVPDAVSTLWPLAPQIPADVERATILLMGAYLRARGRDPLLKSESVDSVASTSWWVPGVGDELPSPEAAQLLQPYRRIVG